MKYFVIITLVISLSISAQANLKQKISMAQQTALMQTSQLKLKLNLTNAQSVQTYGIIINAAMNLNNSENTHYPNNKTKTTQIKNNYIKEFKRILSTDQLELYRKIINDNSKKDCCI